MNWNQERLLDASECGNRFIHLFTSARFSEEACTNKADVSSHIIQKSICVGVFDTFIKSKLAHIGFGISLQSGGSQDQHVLTTAIQQSD